MNVLIPVAGVLHEEILGNSVRALLIAALTAAIIFVVLVVTRRIMVSRLGVLTARTRTRIDDIVVAMLAATRTWVILAVAILAALSSLRLGRVDAHLPAVMKLVVLWQIALWGVAAVTFWMTQTITNRTAENDRTSVAMITAIGVGVKAILWVLVVITALTSVFGLNVTPWITGLGVSGIAVALAVQNILGDLLAALAIVFDKPFDVGDFIGVDQIAGTVEHIGLKTTRLRSISGEQVIIGNSDVLKSRLRNYRRMTQRRILFQVGVTYDTPVEIMEKLPGVVRDIITSQSNAKFDRSHVSAFADSSITIESVYHVLSPDYGVYMDLQQAINLQMMRRFADLHVEFALPSRTLYHVGLPEPMGGVAAADVPPAVGPDDALEQGPDPAAVDRD